MKIYTILDVQTWEISLFRSLTGAARHLGIGIVKASNMKRKRILYDNRFLIAEYEQPTDLNKRRVGGFK